jgi:hypothetical protein
MIKYQLVESALTSEKGVCHAIISCSGNLNLDQILEHMVSEGTGLTKPQALAYFEKLTQVIMYYSELGFSINTPLFRIRPAISGKFNGKGDLFDPKRHKLHFCLTPGTRLTRHKIEMKVVKISQTSVAPLPLLVVDSQTDVKDGTLTVGSISKLSGKRLNFDKNDLRQGVFFIPTDNPKTEIRATSYSGIKPSELHFLIPVMMPGDYKVVVKKLSESGNKLLTGQLCNTITVVNL